MGFFRSFFRRRPADPAAGSGPGRATASTAPAAVVEADAQPFANAADMLNALSERMEGAPSGPQCLSVWDIADDTLPEAVAAAGSVAAPGTMAPDDPAPQRASRRNKTRLIGFDTSQGASIGLFDDDDAATATATAPEPAPAPAPRRNKTRMIGFETSAAGLVGLFDEAGPGDTPDATARETAPGSDNAAAVALPVGWVVVTAGPGRGTTTTLYTGSTAIGRGAGATVALKDTALPEGVHATLTHDITRGRFFLNASGTGVPVSLGGQALQALADLASGAEIQVGETALRFIALCDDTFAWDEHSQRAGASGWEAGHVAKT